MVRAVHSSRKLFHQFRFKAMNTDMELQFWSAEEEIPRINKLAVDWFNDAEKRFSRFREDSELSRLNLLSGEPCMVSNSMLEVILLAEGYREATNGVYNSLILNALKQAGYCESSENVRVLSVAEHTPLIPVVEVLQKHITVNSAMKSVQLPSQTGMDLGGIVKSWAVKRLAGYLHNKLMLERGLINAGGDLTVWNRSRNQHKHWLIGIENPWHDHREIGILAMLEGAAATSSKLGRQWLTLEGRKHHLIDPATMLPSDSDVEQVTVSGKDIVECEIWAKVICILGQKKGMALFAQQTSNYEALIFTSGQQIHFYGKKESIGKKWLEAAVDYYNFSNTY